MSQKILYVEDEPDIREVACMALELSDELIVEACDSGADAIAKVDAFAPDLILLDVMMPGMDGPATLAELRKRPIAALTPVVFMTAKVQREEIDRFLALGAVAVIPKPFDPLTLADQVQAILQRTQE